MVEMTDHILLELGVTTVGTRNSSWIHCGSLDWAVRRPMSAWTVRHSKCPHRENHEGEGAVLVSVPSVVWGLKGARPPIPVLSAMIKFSLTHR